MTINFKDSYPALQKSAQHFNIPLSPEIIAVCHLSSEQYTAIYNALSHYDQCDLEDRFSKSRKHLRLIVDLAQIGIRNEKTRHEVVCALDNLQVICAYQQGILLVDDLKISKDLESLQDYYKQIPLEKRVDVAAKTILLKKYLPLTVQRHTALEILELMKPQDRQDALPNVHFLASCCTTAEEKSSLLHFFKPVDPACLPVFISDLSALLARVSKDSWPDIQWSLQGANTYLVIHRIQPFLQSMAFLANDDLRKLLNIVIEFYQHPSSLFGALPLLYHCADTTHITRIIRRVIGMPDEVRALIVTQTASLFADRVPDRVDSRDIYGALRMLERAIISQIMHAFMFNQMHGNMPEADFVVHRDDFVLHPTKVLRNLVEYIQINKATSFKVEFVGEGGAVDLGGPAKEFLSALFAGVCKKLRFEELSNGLCRPKKAVLTEEEAQAYNDIGQLFAFCINTDFMIGMQLESGVFTALSLLLKNDCPLSITEISTDPRAFKEYFSIYEAMKSHNEEDILSLNLMKLSIDDELTTDVLCEAMPKTIVPILAILQGMRSCPYPNIQLTSLSAQDLERHIQGTIDVSAVLACVQYGPGVTKEKKKWIKRWISSIANNPQKMKQFLKLITGTPGLGNKPLHINMEGELLQISTCTNSLTLPNFESEEIFVEEFNKAVENETYFSTR